MDTVNEIVDIKVQDGTMPTYIYRPDDDQPHPAVIVIQEIFGVNANVRGIAERFASEGYVAAAPDIFYRSGRLLEVPYTDFDQARALAGSVPGDGLMNDLKTLVRHLQAYPHALQGRLGITGYCFGGRVSFTAATAIPEITTAAVYYGGGIAAEGGPFDQASNITAPIIGLFGAEDQNPSPDDTKKLDAELTRLGKAHEFHTYEGAGHGFMCEDRGSYREDAANDAWEKTLAFFAKHLGTPAAAG